jgi:DNA invertase Pin-like site-specific DNA recombinase
MKTKNFIGYARVSTGDQNLSMQLDELKAHGCKKIYTDKASGAKNDRHGLTECLKSLCSGDVLVVWKLDRLGRSLPHLVSIVSSLKEKGVGFKSLRDGAIDTTTPSGNLIFNIFASLASFELELIRERTNAGLKAARARGKIGGRRPKNINDPVVKTARRMHADGLSNQEICSTLKISGSTLHRYLNMGGDNE